MEKAHLLKDGEEKTESLEWENLGQTVVCACSMLTLHAWYIMQGHSQGFQRAGTPRGHLPLHLPLPYPSPSFPFPIISPPFPFPSPKNGGPGVSPPEKNLNIDCCRRVLVHFWVQNDLITVLRAKNQTFSVIFSEYLFLNS